MSSKAFRQGSRGPLYFAICGNSSRDNCCGRRDHGAVGWIRLPPPVLCEKGDAFCACITNLPTFLKIITKCVDLESCACAHINCFIIRLSILPCSCVQFHYNGEKRARVLALWDTCTTLLHSPRYREDYPNLLSWSLVLVHPAIGRSNGFQFLHVRVCNFTIMFTTHALSDISNSRGSVISDSANLLL